MRIGRVQPDALRFAGDVDVTTAVGDMEQLHDLASLMRSHPDYRPRQRVIDAVRAVIESGRFRLLD